MKWLIALAGGIIGGGLGFAACYGLVVKTGLYALVIPGFALGYGMSFAGIRNVALAIVAGVSALGLGVFTDWYIFPFAKDKSIGFYLAHLGSVSPLMLLMIAIGGFVAFYSNFRRADPAA